MSRLLILLTSIYIGLTGAAAAAEKNTPPLKATFNFKNIGSEKDIEIEIHDRSEYSIFMNFLLREPSHFSRLLDRYSTEDATHIGNILGAPRKNDSGQWIETGAPIKLIIKIYEQNNRREILSTTTEQPKTTPTYMGRTAELLRLHLEPGLYIIKIKYLNGSQELSSLKCNLIVSRSHHNK